MEKLLLRSSLILIALLGLIRCGGSVSDEISGIDAYAIVQNQFTDSSLDSLAGIGLIRFINPAASNERTLKLKGSLDTASSSLTAYFYSDNVNINNNSGIEVQFNRAGSGVEGKIVVRSAVSTIVTNRFAFYVPANIDVLIQVRSTTNGARVLIWRRDIGSYTVANADVNSGLIADVNPVLPNYGGLGNYIGVGLQNATLKAAQVTAATAL